MGNAFNPRGKHAMLDSKPVKKTEKRTRENVTDDEIQNRMVARFLNEAAYCLQVRCDVHAMTPAVAACGDCVRGPRAVTACCNRVL